MRKNRIHNRLSKSNLSSNTNNNIFRISDNKKRKKKKYQKKKKKSTYNFTKEDKEDMKTIYKIDTGFIILMVILSLL